jgi:hypothetical protein
VKRKVTKPEHPHSTPFKSLEIYAQLTLSKKKYPHSVGPYRGPLAQPGGILVPLQKLAPGMGQQLVSELGDHIGVMSGSSVNEHVVAEQCRSQRRRTTYVTV